MIEIYVKLRAYAYITKYCIFCIYASNDKLYIFVRMISEFKNKLLFR